MAPSGFVHIRIPYIQGRDPQFVTDCEVAGEVTDSRTRVQRRRYLRPRPARQQSIQKCNSRLDQASGGRVVKRQRFCLYGMLSD